MKKKILTLMLMAALSVSALAGCGSSAEPTTSDSAADAGETAENTEAECEHEWAEATCAAPKTCTLCGETEGQALEHTWVEATFAAPKTCSVCGETEGERKQTYVEEHGLEFCRDTSWTRQGLRYNENDYSKYEFIDTDFSITGITVEDAEMEGYQTVTVDRTADGCTWSDGTENRKTTINISDFFICDIYSGRVVPRASIWEDMEIEYDTEIEWEGKTYTVGYTETSNWIHGEWLDSDDGGQICPVTWETSYTITIPKGYDGFALQIKSLTEPPTENLAETAGEINDMEEEYIMDRWDDTSLLFRVSDIYETLNPGKQFNPESASDKNLAGAVIDDSREQGSIGESGLPYYKLGFSPEDFTIGGISVYDGKSAEELYAAVDLPDWGEFDGEGWSKQLNSDAGVVYLDFRSSNGSVGCVKYTDNSEERSILFSSIDGCTIASADSVHSAVIPGETTFAEAVKLLGIEDLVRAMGIEGDDWKSVGDFIFESQFSEETHCWVRWEDDKCLDIWWNDRNGKKFGLLLAGETDVIDDYMQIKSSK